MRDAYGKTSFKDFETQKMIPNLDGLRAISILMVILHHSVSFQIPYLSTFQENGRYGVHFFFVISGFLITTLFIQERKATGDTSLYNFYIRRSLRLFPLYYLTLAFVAFAVYVLKLYSPENQQLFKDKLPSYIFYYSNMLPTATQGPFFYAWSLAAEEQFYLLFGLLFAFFKAFHVIILMSLLLMVKYFTLWILPNMQVSQFANNLFNYQPSILMGVLLAYGLNSKSTFDLFNKYFVHSFALVFLVIIFFAFTSLKIISDKEPTFVYLFLLILTLIVGGASLIGPISLLSNSFISYIGKISYGMYLLHMFAIMAIAKSVSSPFLFLILSTLLTIILAAISYRYFETPFLKLKKHFEVKRN